MIPSASLRRLFMAQLAAAMIAAAQVPAKADLPYLKQAGSLIPTEVAQARKDGTVFVVDGPESPLKTPSPLPIFFVKADKMMPDRFQLFRMESKGGHREFRTSESDVLHMEVTKERGGAWKMAVADTLDAGEYVLSNGEAGQVFCFQVF